LLAGRTNAYFTVQSFLAIAYASANVHRDALFTLAAPALLALGVMSSLHVWPGIKVSAMIVWHWQYKQAQLLRSDPRFGTIYDD